VFAFLEETGQWDDTMILFTSDHAEQLGDHYLLGKIAYYDQSYRIPLVIKDPARKDQAGRIETAFTESVDVMPTIVDWLGGTPPRACDGRSLLPLVAGEKPADWRTELHYEFDFRDIFYSEAESALGVKMDEACLCVVQDADYKYVHFASLPPLFFDLRRDPDQFVNLAADPAYATRVLAYAQKALSWRLAHAERTLTHYRSSNQGLQIREDGGAAVTLT
jgi:arylsulfatase A-like enzyme